METTLQPFEFLLCGKFKSYYVVWKHKYMEAERKHLECLNRTMQYGNFLCRNKQVTKNKFKSYYVVWKQAEGPDINQGDIWV